MSRRFRQVLSIAGGTLLACVGYVWQSASQASESNAPSTLATPPSATPEPAAKARAVADAPPAQPAVDVAPAKSPPALDDAALMTELRSLLSTNPERALALARDENQKLPASPNAPERAWIAVRALDDLRRFHEAQTEVRVMLERYPGSHFTEDAERHTLIYPLDQISREEQQRR
jgi:hypothetical protein